MRRRLESVLGNNELYRARREEYDTKQKIPFRVAPSPLELSSEQKNEVQRIGHDVVHYFSTVDELYKSNSEVAEILNTGKPEIFLIERPLRYLFVRPDFIITEEGFKICEMETSPFGLALAEVLNQAYRQGGFETMVADDTLPQFVRANTPMEGRIIYSNKTKSYAGQMTFLAEKVFSGKGRAWEASKADEITPEKLEHIYRGFYLSEYLEDPVVSDMLEKQIKKESALMPSPTPHMEEKAILSFIWDKRFEQYLRKQLGQATFDHLRGVIPPTWIVGQEKHFAPGLPANMSSTTGLATLSRSKRTFVLKSSGFSVHSSWAEGVNLLHEKSATQTKELLQKASDDVNSLYVVQQFTKGKNVPIALEGGVEGQPTTMSAKGKLVAIKATGCENTDFIHASSSSVNTAVS
jgi:hypothetical protein